MEVDDGTQTNGSSKLASNSAVTDRMVDAAWRAYVEARDGKPMHAAIEAALREQPAPEPVAWLDQEINCAYTLAELDGGTADGLLPLYANPPQRKPLTEEEIVDAVQQADLDWQVGWTLDEHEPNRFTTLVRAIERAHGIGGEK